MTFCRTELLFERVIIFCGVSRGIIQGERRKPDTNDGLSQHIGPYAQGRVEAIWGADAKQFKPERWINEKGELKRESQGKWPAFHGGRKNR